MEGPVADAVAALTVTLEFATTRSDYGPMSPIQFTIPTPERSPSALSLSHAAPSQPKVVLSVSLAVP